MDKILKDLQRLSLMIEWGMGQESFTLSMRMADFSTYYAKRFVANLTHVFKDFSSSEIADYHHRHSRKLAVLMKSPFNALKEEIIPIPKGMIHPYKQTIDTLSTILLKLSPQDLKQDLIQLMSPSSSSRPYSLSDFDQAKDTIGHLFAQVGPSHSTVHYALGSATDLNEVNDRLLHLTSIYYPDVLALRSLLITLEQDDTRKKEAFPHQEIILQRMMTLAYRLSIFAMVMKHVQEIEHAFVKSLAVLITKIEKG